MAHMDVDYFLDRYSTPQLQEMVREIDNDAVRHDIEWHTVSERATRMREIRASMIEALTIKKATQVTIDKFQAEQDK